jgi:hypothetical protein
MITKYRNRAFFQMAVAIILSVALGFICHNMPRRREESEGRMILALFVYIAAYVMWVLASLTLARARGYNRDAMGAVFSVCCILGFCCFPILPILFPFYIIFGLRDLTKDKLRWG